MGTACPPEGTTVTGPRPPLLLPAFTLVLRFHSYPVKEPRPQGWGPAGLPACWAACALLAWELLRGGRWDTVSYLFPPDSATSCSPGQTPGCGWPSWGNILSGPAELLCLGPPCPPLPKEAGGAGVGSPMVPSHVARGGLAPSWGSIPSPSASSPSACLPHPPQTLGGLGSAAAEVLGGAPPCCPVSRAAQPRSELIVLPQLLRACPPPPGQSAGGG